MFGLDPLIFRFLFFLYRFNFRHLVSVQFFIVGLNPMFIFWSRLDFRISVPVRVVVYVWSQFDIIFLVLVRFCKIGLGPNLIFGLGSIFDFWYRFTFLLLVSV